MQVFALLIRCIVRILRVLYHQNNKMSIFSYYTIKTKILSRKKNTGSIDSRFSMELNVQFSSLEYLLLINYLIFGAETLLRLRFLWYDGNWRVSLGASTRSFLGKASLRPFVDEIKSSSNLPACNESEEIMCVYLRLFLLYMYEIYIK